MACLRLHPGSRLFTLRAMCPTRFILPIVSTAILCAPLSAQETPAAPTFKDALATEYVTDAVLKSARTNRWEKVKKVK